MGKTRIYLKDIDKDLSKLDEVKDLFKRWVSEEITSTELCCKVFDILGVEDENEIKKTEK